ncbi:MAG: GNAT family N-acetyltransferase [Gammaproteobacteria bacterium]|nr:GNAT family N-acetyltransferase [Gammaproteobacteria bacterium]
MKFICYSDWELLPYSANMLFEQAQQESIFLSRTWFETVTTGAIEDGVFLSLACVVSGDRVMAILPLVMNAKHTGYSLKHGYTAFYSLLLADDEQARVLACLGQGLSEMPLNGLLLEPVADDDYKLSRLQQVLEASGYSCSHTFRHYNWIYRTQGQSYKEYLAARPSTLRNTLSRKSRKLEREHGYDIRLFIGDKVPQGMPDYYTVYNASWKQNELSNANFLDGFVGGFSQAGWSRLGILYVKGQPVAAQLWFVCHGKASIFRLAYDEAWKSFSPGSILTGFLMQYVIDTDKVKEIDFLTGNDAYKQDWMSERRVRNVLSCVKSAQRRGWFGLFVESLKRMLEKLAIWGR